MQLTHPHWEQGLGPGRPGHGEAVATYGEPGRRFKFFRPDYEICRREGSFSSAFYVSDRWDSRLSAALVPNLTWANNGQKAIHFQQGKTSNARSIGKGEMVKEILEGRKLEPDGPFNFSKDQVYTRVEWLVVN
ncbi:MAG: hypothetical protein IH971_04520 [Candidatus Marinimicrobia bacterium]|nr:hypothetical protein [Candidatus Neomarinimicrobiota bacterium]